MVRSDTPQIFAAARMLRLCLLQCILRVTVYLQAIRGMAYGLVIGCNSSAVKLGIRSAILRLYLSIDFGGPKMLVYPPSEAEQIKRLLQNLSIRIEDLERAVSVGNSQINQIGFNIERALPKLLSATEDFRETIESLRKSLKVFTRVGEPLTRLFLGDGQHEFILVLNELSMSYQFHHAIASPYEAQMEWERTLKDHDMNGIDALPPRSPSPLQLPSPIIPRLI
ncbi:uncharacterized protein FPOAC1_013204 [Fusarium poae]|uniref:uncharacterized protein n=1 Tax=Fusarium poae TaxID=36050 RepID=UPI001D058628|nr:uncharacterized protein FPOAC1_013204 [Fusarium poae]KAG8665225.1 hypothetical protein FPOAC1_013204 [Fusarium poae]